MPARWNWMTESYEVTCTRCGRIASAAADRSDPYVQRSSGTGPARDDRALEHFRWHSGQGRYVSRCRDCEREARAANPRNRQTPTVDPTTRRFGVELECIFPSHVTRYGITDALIRDGLSDWRVVGDGSLRGNGWEVVSPVLSGDAGIRALEKACRVLKALGATVNASCGTHVHHEIRDLSLSAIRRFARSWANNQGLIDGLVAQSRRGSYAEYCASFTTDDAEEIERASSMTYLRIDRYKAINFQAYTRYGTVEVRQHQGTLNAEKLTQWIRFAQAMIATCAEEQDAIAPQPSVLALLQSFGERLAEVPRTFLLGRAVEFGHAVVSLQAPAVAA